MKDRLRLLLFTIGFPLLACGLAWACIAKIDGDVREQLKKQYPDATAEQLAGVTVSSLAAKGAFKEGAELPGLYRGLSVVRTSAVVTALAGVALMAGIFFAGRATRTRRDLLLRLFRPGLFITLTAVGVLTAAQAFEIAYAAYYFESIFVGQVHFIIILGIAIGGFLAFVAVIRAMLALNKPTEFRVFGHNVSRAQQPALWAAVDEVCAQLSATPPDNLVLGLEPSFFVTESEVTSNDGKVSGRTLFVSLTLSRILTPAELKAIIGHEMAHFIGEDTVFSQRFMPVYRGTVGAIQNLQRNAVHGSVAIAQIPAVTFLVYFYRSFVTSEKNLSRIRETEADSVGAKVAGTDSFASALVKVHAYSDEWPKVLEDVRFNADAVKNRASLISPFLDRAQALTPETLAKVGEHHIFHPADSHPTLAVRLTSLSKDLPGVLPLASLPPRENSAAELIVDVDGLAAAQSEELRKLIRPE